MPSSARTCERGKLPSASCLRNCAQRFRRTSVESSRPNASLSASSSGIAMRTTTTWSETSVAPWRADTLIMLAGWRCGAAPWSGASIKMHPHRTDASRWRYCVARFPSASRGLWTRSSGFRRGTCRRTLSSLRGSCRKLKLVGGICVCCGALRARVRVLS
ncbi:hypothetical protein D3C78_1221180 [compost metagenome]